MKNLLVIASLTASLASGYALAAQTGPGGSTAATGESPATHKEFLKLDVNKDGYIERKEIKHNAALKNDFARVAKNGKLNEAEFAAWEVHQVKTAKPVTRPETGRMPAGTMGKPGAGSAYK